MHQSPAPDRTSGLSFELPAPALSSSPIDVLLRACPQAEFEGALLEAGSS